MSVTGGVNANSGNITSVGTNITGAGAMTVAAGGSNQNLTLSGSGTGAVVPTPNVGIGTSPATSLDVSGTIRATSKTVPTSGAGVEVQFYQGAGALFAFDRGASSFKQLTIYGNPLFLYGSNGVGMSVNAAGNVGIDNNNPAGRFLVSLPGRAYRL